MRARGLVREEMGDSAGAARYFCAWFLSARDERGERGAGLRVIYGICHAGGAGERGRGKISAAEAVGWALDGKRGGAVWGPRIGSDGACARGFSSLGREEIL